MILYWIVHKNLARIQAMVSLIIIAVYINSLECNIAWQYFHNEQ